MSLYHCNECDSTFEILEMCWNKEHITACPCCNGTEHIEELKDQEDIE